ncbi:MAG: HNH endonuclease [Polyangiaceae bacterium]
MQPVLVLNRHYAPVRVATVQRAVVLMYAGVALALDEHGNTCDWDTWRELPVRSGDDVIPLVRGGLRVPRVVYLQRYDKLPKQPIRLSRKNIMARDGFQCQYCAKRPLLRSDLNIDHVLPKCRGGAGTWENLVTSCKPCNVRKGRMTPAEANMHLLRKPFRPRWSFVAQILLSERQPFKEWEPFVKTG